MVPHELIPTTWTSAAEETCGPTRDLSVIDHWYYHSIIGSVKEILVAKFHSGVMNYPEADFEGVHWALQTRKVYKDCTLKWKTAR